MSHLVNANLAAPPAKVVAVSPNDTTDLPDGVCRGVIVDADGTLNVVWADGTALNGWLVFKGRNSGFIKRVKTGGSGPTVIQAMY